MGLLQRTRQELALSEQTVRFPKHNHTGRNGGVKNSGEPFKNTKKLMKSHFIKAVSHSQEDH